MTGELTKVCTKCGRELPLSEYCADKSRKDGLTCWCKSCWKKHTKIYFEARHEERLKKNRVYYECVKKPSCPRVGGYGAVFETFTCEICGKEFRRLKSNVDNMYEYQGYLPRFCSRECLHESRRKTLKSKYEKEIERIKKET